MPRGMRGGMRGGGRGGARRAGRRRRRVRRRRVMLVGGLVGFGVYKMTKSQAQQVEQHSGVPPEEMTDEELSQSMDDLDIPKQKIDASDQEAAEGVGGTAPRLRRRIGPARSQSWPNSETTVCSPTRSSRPRRSRSSTSERAQRPERGGSAGTVALRAPGSALATRSGQTRPKDKH